MPQLGAWALRRLLTGMPVNGELESLPATFRPLGELLAGLGPEQRGAAWEGFLAGRADADALVNALAAVDPTGAPPEAVTGDDEAAHRPRFKLTRAADVTCRPVDWLWQDRVPRGMLSLFAGDPKLGKSLVTLACAAAVSRGAALPGGEPQPPASVIILSAEDDPARTIVPRLKAAGADLSMIHIIESVYLGDGTEALPNLRKDVDVIEEAAAGLGDSRLIIIDPISAYLGGVDDHKNGALRGLLSPLKSLAERLNVAVVLVSHLNKGSGTNGKHRVMGSIAYVGSARANFLFVRDRRDDSTGRFLMLDNGCNLAADLPGLAYQIGVRADGPAIEWGDVAVDVTAAQALAAEADSPDERAELAACDRWLSETLGEGPVSSQDVIRAGRTAGFNPAALNRSKVRIGAKSQRTGFGTTSKCFWALRQTHPYMTVWMPKP
jgi:hypothetical protein